jgi:putative membrane protein
MIRAHAKRHATLAVSFVFAISALPVLAQQQTTPSVPTPPYGYSHMMWGEPWGWHPFMMVGPIFMLLALIGAVAIFVWLVRWATGGHPFHGRSRAALDILEERFAKGEIDKAEFEDKRKLLRR